MTITIDQQRLAEITKLDKGSHDSISAGVCAMEAAAYIAGEPWSDQPQCVCPVIAAFMRSWNDALPDIERTELLLPLITKTVGTRGSAELAERRSLMAADWLVRVNTPAWLRLAGLNTHADNLAALPEITDMAQVPSIRGPIEAARKDADAARGAARDAARGAARGAARDAARGAAWAAASDAAWTAACDAAWDAAGVAAWTAACDAAGVAAWTAACDAAGVAAWTAACDAASDALKPTTHELQKSAVTLVERMCALTEEDIRPATGEQS